MNYHNSYSSLVIFLSFLIFNSHVLLQGRPAMALPLYTNSRWIVDEEGNRVKLACVNWASHLEPVVAEGLSKQPMDSISKKIVSMGFNCVRFTWPLFFATNNDFLASPTVRQSFQSLGLVESIAGIQVNNPGLLDLSLVQAFQTVVSNLGDNDLMVILDNHISKPGWCCSISDGSNFFGDRYFDPEVWVKGLTRMATMFNGTSNVVGMSLRNELRGAKQSVNNWYRYMQKGAEAVHSANPNVLVILSGLNYDKDFTFLLKQPISLTFRGKLVLEVHWYAFWEGQGWATGNPNQVRGSMVNNLMRRAGFMLENGWPLFLSELGLDQRGSSNVNDNRFLNCMIGVAAELDLDRALWTLAGSYSLREGVIGMEESYGVLNWEWCGSRNSSFLHKISALQSPFQGPGLLESRTSRVIFHPGTGLCVLRKSLSQPLELGPCAESESWSYTPQKTLVIKGTYFCLQADGVGKPAKLGVICTSSNSKWEETSDSKMHLSSSLASGNTVCLDVDSSNIIVTKPCVCLKQDNTCDPGSQWFKIINSTRSSSAIIRLPGQMTTLFPDDYLGECGRGEICGLIW